MSHLLAYCQAAKHGGREEGGVVSVPLLGQQPPSSAAATAAAAPRPHRVPARLRASRLYPHTSGSDGGRLQRWRARAAYGTRARHAVRAGQQDGKDWKDTRNKSAVVDSGVARNRHFLALNSADHQQSTQPQRWTVSMDPLQTRCPARERHSHPPSRRLSPRLFARGASLGLDVLGAIKRACQTLVSLSCHRPHKHTARAKQDE